MKNEELKELNASYGNRGYLAGWRIGKAHFGVGFVMVYYGLCLRLLQKNRLPGYSKLIFKKRLTKLLQRFPLNSSVSF